MVPPPNIKTKSLSQAHEVHNYHNMAMVTALSSCCLIFLLWKCNLWPSHCHLLPLPPHSLILNPLQSGKCLSPIPTPTQKLAFLPTATCCGLISSQFSSLSDLQMCLIWELSRAPRVGSISCPSHVARGPVSTSVSLFLLHLVGIVCVSFL